MRRVPAPNHHSCLFPAQHRSLPRVDPLPSVDHWHKMVSFTVRYQRYLCFLRTQQSPKDSLEITSSRASWALFFQADLPLPPTQPL